jgi:flagellar capping protein FliD
VNTGLLVSKAGTSTSKIDQSALAKKMKEYDTQVSTLKLRLTSQQEYYYNKFTALETYISQMNSQASFFTSSSST